MAVWRSRKGRASAAMGRHSARGGLADRCLIAMRHPRAVQAVEWSAAWSTVVLNNARQEWEMRTRILIRAGQQVPSPRTAFTLGAVRRAESSPAKTAQEERDAAEQLGLQAQEVTLPIPRSARPTQAAEGEDSEHRAEGQADGRELLLLSRETARVVASAGGNDEQGGSPWKRFPRYCSEAGARMKGGVLYPSRLRWAGAGASL